MEITFPEPSALAPATTDIIEHYDRIKGLC